MKLKNRQSEKGPRVRSMNIYGIVLGAFICLLIILIQAEDTNAGYSTNEPSSIDSPHNYPNNYDHKWTFNRAGASQMKVRFNSIDIETGWDYIYVKDGNGNIYSTYSGNYNSVTSNWVPGSKLVIHFVTDGSVTKWGFFLDYLYADFNSDIQSPHNYPNNYDNSWYVHMKYASTIKIKFSTINVESNYDYVRIYDYKGTLKWTFTGSATNKYSPVIKGPKIRIRLTSDYSVTRYGFKIASITTSIDDDSRYEMSILGVANYKNQDNLNNHDADLFKSKFESYYKITQNLRNDAVDDHSFFTEGDHGDIIYYTGHGKKGIAMLGGFNQWWKYAKEDRYFDHVDAYLNSMGNDDWEWTVFAACDIFQDSQRHLKEFLMHDGHGVYGYRDTSWEGWNNDASSDNAIVLDFYDYIRAGSQIEWAWSNANHDNNQFKVSSCMHDKNDDDHFWGFGTVYPDCSSNSDISKWKYD